MLSQRDSPPLDGPTHLSLDHLVLVSDDVETCLAFYARVLGARVHDLDAWRSGAAEYPVVHFGHWKINVHPSTADPQPRAFRPEPGSLDLCLNWMGSVDEAAAHLANCGVPLEEGPIPQEGAAGGGMSVYFRDPDSNLIELITYRDRGGAGAPGP
jgi:catechol 2,3-dioxygenase-like lactoylglutathione lyase family enzyme